ncbi:MAG: PHP domain-containing protein, partial [Peptostreptococcaceae bacterium]|nr:PHP domain-containing protein [Peptostreptococcaceae bacterium]
IGYKNYRIRYDYHTHTVFSHGKGTIEENVKAAIENGLAGIAITDHGPGHLTYGIKRENIPVMRAEIERLKLIYPEIQLLLGIEANIIDKDNNLDITKDEAKLFDCILAGYHFGVLNAYSLDNFARSIVRKVIKKSLWTDESRGKLRDKNTSMVIKAIMENDIKILTHPGDKADFDILKIGVACERRGTLMEISSWHEHLNIEELEILAKTKVKFIVSSDAHKPERIGDCSEAIKRALEAGIRMSRIVNIEEY